MTRRVKNIFTDLPADRSREHFEVLLETPAFRLERILSTGQSTPPEEWFDQDRDEWVLLVSGKAGLRFEHGEVLELGPGDYLHIPAHALHRVEWTAADGPTVWLALHHEAISQ